MTLAFGAVEEGAFLLGHRCVSREERLDGWQEKVNSVTMTGGQVSV